MEKRRNVPFNLSAEDFAESGLMLIQKINTLIQELPDRKVTAGESVSEVRSMISQYQLQEKGIDQKELLDDISSKLIEHSLFNGHPRFMGYITSSPTPVGILSDLLASTINPNVGGWDLSPVASEIEKQVISWIADLIGYHKDCGGILVSGGNMANIVPFFAARKAKANADLRENGWDGPSYRVYCSAETHTWIQKAADLSGMGTKAVRWIECDEDQRMRVDVLERAIKEDISDGYQPFMVVGTAGSVSTGALDPLRVIQKIASAYDLWFHIDGAYGAPVASLENAHPDFRAFADADSIALDPHKWLYSPLEAGCVLVKETKYLSDAYGFRPSYYDFSSEDEDPINFYELGPQNSRGFRALKVWTGLLVAGKQGYREMIEDDIKLAELLYEILDKEPDFEVFSQGMSITTYRYIPEGVSDEKSIDEFNRKLIKVIQRSGKLFVSNALIEDKFLLRSCIVNFRTDVSDIEALPGIIRELSQTVLTD